MKAPPTTPTIGTLRRGLVLQGGGAKGAFQFGVLQELHEKGIQFDVISGTSIGALNGAVVAAGAWDLGNRMWSNLTMRSAFRWSVWGAIYTFFSSLGILYLGWLSTAYDSLLPLLLRRFFQVTAALPAIACFLAFNLMAEGKSRSLQVVFLVCTLAMAAGVCFVVGKRNYSTRLQMTMPAILVGPVALLADLFHNKLINFSGHPKASAFVVLLLNLSPLLLLVGFIHQRINAALLSNGPLREIVEGIVQTGLRCPLFATSASVREYVDPDDYTYTRMHPSFVYVPASESGFLPEYVRINSLKTDSEKAEALLASAALPLGIVPNRRGAEKGIRFVDGGVADNTPWFPLVEALQCDEIVFVLCEPESAAKDETACTRDLWRKRDRLMRVILGKNNNVQNHQMKTLWDFPNPIARKKVPEVVPFRDPQFWPESKTINRVVISPCHSLGNLISGTMKFDRIRAQENIKCGREAARVALAKWRLS